MNKTMSILTALVLCVSLSFADSGEGDFDFPSSMTSMGNSITAPSYNWATGTYPTLVNSHYLRLQSVGANMSYVSNLAQGGARIEHLPGQASNLYDEPVQIDYTLVLMGHNDICGASSLEEMTSVEDFEADYYEALEIMHTYNPDMRVNVVGNIDLSKLYDAAKDKETVYPSPYGGYLTCEQFWNFYTVCPLATKMGEETREAVGDRVDEYNKVLKKGAHAYGYTYTGDLPKADFTAEDVSAYDCFHPSIAGQNLISELTWKTDLFEDVQ